MHEKEIHVIHDNWKSASVPSVRWFNSKFWRGSVIFHYFLFIPISYNYYYWLERYIFLIWFSILFLYSILKLNFVHFEASKKLKLKMTMLKRKTINQGANIIIALISCIWLLWLVHKYISYFPNLDPPRLVTTNSRIT